MRLFEFFLLALYLLICVGIIWGLSALLGAA